MEVTVLEAENRAGGHAHTVDLQLDGRTVPVDTGYDHVNSVDLSQRYLVGGSVVLLFYE